MEFLTANLRLTSNGLRRVNWRGRPHLVTPAVILRNTVLAGSKGALYYPAKEVAARPGMWDGVPVVVDHPIHNGEHISAGDPRARDRVIGVCRNDRMRGTKRVVDVWLDEEKTLNWDKRLKSDLRPPILPRLHAGQPVELSTGLYTENEDRPGVAPDGKVYNAIARDYSADHLAILPDVPGACSVNDGCGLGLAVNANPEGCNQYKECGAGSTPDERALAEVNWMKSPDGQKALKNKQRVIKETEGYLREARRMGNLAEANDLQREVSKLKGMSTRKFVENEATPDGCGLNVNAFCPTGKGGGQDNSCSSRDGGREVEPRGAAAKRIIDRDARNQDAEDASSKARREPSSANHRWAAKLHQDIVDDINATGSSYGYGDLNYHVDRVKFHKARAKATANQYCATGKGGGVDPTCPSTGSDGPAAEAGDSGKSVGDVIHAIKTGITPTFDSRNPLEENREALDKAPKISTVLFGSVNDYAKALRDRYGRLGAFAIHAAALGALTAANFVGLGMGGGGAGLLAPLLTTAESRYLRPVYGAAALPAVFLAQGIKNGLKWARRKLTGNAAEEGELPPLDVIKSEGKKLAIKLMADYNRALYLHHDEAQALKGVKLNLPGSENKEMTGNSRLVTNLDPSQIRVGDSVERVLVDGVPMWKVTANASANQPRHSASGKYLHPNAGTGRGEVHDNACAGFSTMNIEGDGYDETDEEPTVNHLSASRLAASLSLNAGDDDAYNLSALALNAAKEGDHHGAGINHLRAASGHDELAANADTDQQVEIHAQAAAANRAAAKAHAAVLNIFCSTGSGGGIDPSCSSGQGGGKSERQAKAEELMSKPLSKDRAKADRQIKEIEDLTDDLTDNFLEKPTMNRAQKLAALTANCACSKDKSVLNALGDEVLDVLIANQGKIKTITLTTNAMPPQFAKAAAPAVEETCPGCGGAMKGGKCSCGYTANESVGGERMGGGEEDEDNKEDPGAEFKLDKAKEKLQTNRALTIRDLEAMIAQSPQATEVWNAAKEVAQNQKAEMVAQLVANISDPKRRREVFNKFMRTKSKAQLTEMLELQPTAPAAPVANEEQDYAAQYLDLPVYNGAQGGSRFSSSSWGLTDNEAGDVLDLDAARAEYAANSKNGAKAAD